MLNLKKALIVAAVFFVNHDSYAAAADWKEAKMSHVEQGAARQLLEKEFGITIDRLFNSATKGLCVDQLADNAVVMGGDMATRLGLTTGEGLAGQIERNELTTTEFEARLTDLSAKRLMNCSLAY